MVSWRSLLLGSLLQGVALGTDTLKQLTDPQGIEALAQAFQADPMVLAGGMANRAAQLSADGDHGLAAETLDLLAPLADRMGLSRERARLEDASFRIVAPDAFAALQSTGADADATLAHLMFDTRVLLSAHGLDARISGRTKSLYSTWRKMQRKNVGAEQIYDRVALRLVARDEGTLRQALDLLHARHSAVPGEFDDYIRQPKASGYQALHTAVHTPRGVAEFQLRTVAMDEAAEAGDQAHWRYKMTA